MDTSPNIAPALAPLRLRLEDSRGAFADLARAIADSGGQLDTIDLVRVESRHTLAANSTLNPAATCGRKP